MDGASPVAGGGPRLPAVPVGEGPAGDGDRRHPPSHRPGGGFAVVADARLDDRDALCDALGVPHAERAGLDDPDLIARAFARWDRDCPDHLLGDYAFTVWDRHAHPVLRPRPRRRPALLLRRDRARLRLRQRRGGGARRARRRRPARPNSFIDPAFARRQRLWPSPRRRAVGTRHTQLRLLRDGHLIRDTEVFAARGARHGIEYRYPLLDRRLPELALGLPPEQFLRGKWNRWLMRHAAQSLLPSDLCWRLAKDDVHLLFNPPGDAKEEVRRVILRTLEAPGAASSIRARYVDMPRLLDSLRTGRTASPKMARLRDHALALLDGF